VARARGMTKVPWRGEMDGLRRAKPDESSCRRRPGGAGSALVPTPAAARKRLRRGDSFPRPEGRGYPPVVASAWKRAGF